MVIEEAGKTDNYTTLLAMKICAACVGVKHMRDLYLIYFELMMAIRQFFNLGCAFWRLFKKNRLVPGILRVHFSGRRPF